MDDTDEDAFETVAITWSQPEAAVMLAMFEFYGIPAFAVGRWHASVNPPIVVGLQGIGIRVHHAARDEALALLDEVAERPAAVRPYALGSATAYRTIVLLAFIVGIAGALIAEAVIDSDDELARMLIAWLTMLPIGFLMTFAPPTRTPSTFLLPKRRRRETGPDGQRP